LTALGIRQALVLGEYLGFQLGDMALTVLGGHVLYVSASATETWSRDARAEGNADPISAMVNAHAALIGGL
jgi:hypothetical protein